LNVEEFASVTEAKEAGGNKEKFLKLFEMYVKEPVWKNPDLLRKAGWE
jgi:hypothetical protein